MNNYRPSLWSSIPPVTKNLIMINAILFLATVVVRRWGFDLNDVLGMHYWGADKFNPAQMATYMFMHGGLSHIFFNMFALFMFGGMLEQTWGSKRFLFYYMVTGIGAGIIQQIVLSIEIYPVINAFNEAINNHSVDLLKPHESNIFGGLIYSGGGRPSLRDIHSISDMIAVKEVFLNKFTTVGASGAVFGILLAFGMLFPNTELFLMFIPVPIKAKFFVVGYGLLELYLGFANHPGDNVAHFAHIGGMLFGIILILYWKKKRKLYN